MKKGYFAIVILTLIMLCGCGENRTDNSVTVPLNAPETTVVTTAVTAQLTVAATGSADTTTAKTTLAVSSGTAVASDEITAPAENGNEAEEIPSEVFSGILIDEDCSDFEDPPKHDLPCMLMDSCRASGYGLDIQQDDGLWLFYMFDSKGQELAWDYLTHTDRMSELYVTVSGTSEDGIIYVDKLEED